MLSVKECESILNRNNTKKYKKEEIKIIRNYLYSIYDMIYNQESIEYE